MIIIKREVVKIVFFVWKNVYEMVCCWRDFRNLRPLAKNCFLVEEVGELDLPKIWISPLATCKLSTVLCENCSEFLNIHAKEFALAWLASKRGARRLGCFGMTTQAMACPHFQHSLPIRKCWISSRYSEEFSVRILFFEHVRWSEHAKRSGESPARLQVTAENNFGLSPA